LLDDVHRGDLEPVDLAIVSAFVLTLQARRVHPARERDVRFDGDSLVVHRTSYRPGVFCQFDLWRVSREISVGSGQTRCGYVVVGCLPYSRAGAGTLVFSKEAPDLLYGLGDCLAKLGALPETLVWDREGALHAGDAHPTEPFAALCGELRVGWRFPEPHDPQSKGVVERLQGHMETSFEPGRSFAGELDYQEQLDRWFDGRANVRFHRTLITCSSLARLRSRRAHAQARMRGCASSRRT
jgi:hypothetical protein